jgi:hypothetical protein
MTNTITVTPGTIFLEDFLVNIANGEYKVPIFQRNFVWKSSQMIELFDSILKGYPIGNLLFWQTDQEYKTKDKNGVETTETGRSQHYLLPSLEECRALFEAYRGTTYDWPEEMPRNDISDDGEAEF